MWKCPVHGNTHGNGARKTHSRNNGQSFGTTTKKIYEKTNQKGKLTMNFPPNCFSVFRWFQRQWLSLLSLHQSSLLRRIEFDQDAKWQTSWLVGLMVMCVLCFVCIWLNVKMLCNHHQPAHLPVRRTGESSYGVNRSKNASMEPFANFI